MRLRCKPTNSVPVPQTTSFIYLLHFGPLSPFPIDSWTRFQTTRNSSVSPNLLKYFKVANPKPYHLACPHFPTKTTMKALVHISCSNCSTPLPLQPFRERGVSASSPLLLTPLGFKVFSSPFLAVYRAFSPLPLPSQPHLLPFSHSHALKTGIPGSWSSLVLEGTKTHSG